ncbi:MAG: hypothetical protein GX033_09890 [Firmicutes bacterium]|nr:hypothetical protein [Bacillota bacterium]
MNLWLCPNCGSRAVGKVGHEQFYCADCCIEFAKRKQGIVQFQVADDGTLVSLTEQPNN